VLARVLLTLALDAALLALAFGGSRAMLRDPRALALLGIWCAGNIVLAVVRPVRGQDVVRSERDVGHLVVLALVPLVAPAVGAWAAHRGWATVPWARAVSWIAVGVTAAGLALRVASMRRLGARFSPLVAVQRVHPLETGGPYAWVRHPGYLGALLACLGGSLAFGSAFALPLVALMLGVQWSRIRHEEAVLAGHFGPAWTAYAARTGALLPRALARGGPASGPSGGS
jgi:protein-S-isoprenylcysteine O-methyltransferase Ste14